MPSLSLTAASRLARLVTLAALTLPLVGCADDPAQNPDGGTGVDMGQPADGGSMDGAPNDTGLDGGALPDGGDADLGSPGALTTYVARPDERDCAWPLCGGYFVSAANHAETLCADGTREAACYVAVLDWAESGLDAAEQARVLAAQGGFLLDGSLEERRFQSQWTLGALVVESAFVAEWGTPLAQPVAAPYHKLARTGLLCLIDPCFNIDTDTVNSAARVTISGLDLDPAGASGTAEALGYEALEGGTLRASGVISTDAVAGPGGFGETYHADQFFLQMPFDAL